MSEGGDDRGRWPVSGREMLAVMAWSALIVALTVAPYLWAIERAPDEHQFGGFIWGVDDGNVYLSWMRQASEGRLLLRNQYTSLPQDPHFFNIFLQALGRITAWTGQHPAVIFHAARLAGGLVLLPAIYLLAAFVTRSVAARWAALALASLGSGVGWAVGLWVQAQGSAVPSLLRPPDYAPPPPHTWQVVPEAVTFLSLLLNPLFVWSMALLCLVMIASVVALERRSVGWSIAAGLTLLVVANAHTYDVVVAFGTVGAYALTLVALGKVPLRRAVVHCAIIFVLAAPAPVWAWWASHQDPAYLAKLETKTLSPRPVDMLVGYGLIALLAAAGAWWAIRRRGERPRALLPVCWAVVNAAIIYLPVSFQRKLVEGMHIPLCVLAGLGLAHVIGRWLAPPAAEDAPEPGARPVGERRRRLSARAQAPPERLVLLIALAVALTLPSNALFVTGCLENVATNNRGLLHVLQPPVYLTFEEVRAIRYLAREAEPDDLVVGSPFTSSYVPVRARCLVFAGHWAETLHYPDAVSYVVKMLMPERSPRVLRAALREIGADWVLFGPREALMAAQLARSAGGEVPDEPGEHFRRLSRGFLEERFTSGEVTVYHFNPDGLPPAASVDGPRIAPPDLP